MPLRHGVRTCSVKEQAAGGKADAREHGNRTIGFWGSDTVVLDFDRPCFRPIWRTIIAGEGEAIGVFYHNGCPPAPREAALNQIRALDIELGIAWYPRAGISVRFREK